jgi:hypothetical protein
MCAGGLSNMLILLMILQEILSVTVVSVTAVPPDRTLQRVENES